MKYGTLRQQNPAYTAARWEELGDLYEGGYTLADKASRYLPRFVGETRDRYQERVRAASYLNYLAPIADTFVAYLFDQELTLTQAADAKDPTTVGGPANDDGFWEAFAHDVDLCGASLVRLLRDVFTTALIKGKAVVAVDMPARVNELASRADEEATEAARGYAFEVAPEALLDWEYGERGRFAWAILHRLIERRESPEESRNRVVEEFKVWRLDGGVATWDLFRTRARKANEVIRDDEEIPRVDGGTTTFKQIPLIEFIVPPGLWVGNKLGLLAKEHFERRSALNSAENKSLFTIPYVALGPEVSAPGEAMPSAAQQRPGRGRDPRAQFLRLGYVVLGKDDKLGFAEPEGRAYALVDKQLERLVDEMYRVVHQMAASVAATKTALSRSGESKGEDRRATEIVLAAYGALVREFATRMYGCLSAARGENVVWTPHGLDRYELEDRDGILKEALAVDGVSIPSPTFRKLYKTKLAYALLGNVPPETQEAIREEIETGVDGEAEAHALEESSETPDEAA
jgi:hypothetical protein